jgi:stearoyl-CoA desaturase (delta-9 desaturase)
MAQEQTTQTLHVPLSRLNISFLLAAHVLGIGGSIGYLMWHGLSTAALVIGLVWTYLTILAISAGYHRLFSHRTYQAHPTVELVLLCFGAAAFQNSALNWSAEHRRHHKYVDGERDPYNARRGFWYSHIGWVLEKTAPAMELTPVPDLERMRLVRWQHRHYPAIGGAVGFLAPLLLGWAFGDPWGGLILGGIARLVVVYHATFSINSFAHWLGAQPYSDADSSRDSHLTALITMGEGYHNFHHTFPLDYRNGVRPYDFDPTKWTIRALAAVGLAGKLRRAPLPLIERARWQMKEKSVATQALPAPVLDRAQRLRRFADEKLAQWQALVARYESMRHEQDRHAREVLRGLARQIRDLRKELGAAHAEWRRLLRSPAPTTG